MTSSLLDQPSNHATGAIRAKVIQFGYLGETDDQREALKNNIRALIETLPYEIGNLLTGHRRRSDLTVKAIQADTSPVFRYQELSDRRIQKTLHQWMLSGMTVDFIVYETHRPLSGTLGSHDPKVTYAWLFERALPETTGEDMVSGASDMPSHDHFVCYEVEIAGTHKDDLFVALKMAEDIEDKRLAEVSPPPATSEKSVPSPSPAPEVRSPSNTKNQNRNTKNR